MVSSRVFGSVGRSWMLAGLCVAAATGCEAGGGDTNQAPPPPPTGNDLLLASARVILPPPTAAADLPDPQSQGAQLVAKYCGGACHGIAAPSTHSATDWPVVLRRMWLRMEKIDTTFQVPVPTNAERVVIMEYLLANALRVTAGRLPDHPGRDLYVATCSRCHALPDVRQHGPQDWVAVVRRMNGRMETMLNEVLSQDQLQRVVLYLEKASARS